MKISIDSTKHTPSSPTAISTQKTLFASGTSQTPIPTIQPMWRVMPEFVAKHPRYERVGLKDLCTQIHQVYKENDVARLTTEMYLSPMEPAMKPSDAFAKMAHREIERVAIDELEGRVTAMLVTPYPPGIPLLIPGERFNKTIVNYLVS